MLKPDSVRRRGRDAAIITAVIALLSVLYMGLWRGIWFDELLHFAVGGMSFEYLVRAIDYTSVHVNHGQTGVYLLLDWGLLRIWGASAVALRLPSLISALVLLGSAVVFMRAKGFGAAWRVLAVLALGANETLMFYAGEARPYMPLAASAGAMLAYYALPQRERCRWWARLLAVGGFLLGAVMHPYWIFVWGAIATASLAGELLLVRKSRSWSRAWRYLAPAFALPALALYFVVGRLTWMRRILDFGWDTDDLYNWSSLTNAFLQNHFSWVPYAYAPRGGTGEVDAGPWIPVVVAGFLALATAWLIAAPACRTRRLIPPVIVFAAGVATSVIASFLSYRSHYVIYDRQWVAGMVLTTLAATWFFAEWTRQVRRQSRWAALPAGFFVAMVLISATISMSTQAAVDVGRFEAWQVVQTDDRPVEALMVGMDDDTFAYEPRGGTEYLADRNIVQGGRVWDVFTRWYNHQAGLRPETWPLDLAWSQRIWRDIPAEARLCLPNHPENCAAG